MGAWWRKHQVKGTVCGTRWPRGGGGHADARGAEDTAGREERLRRMLMMQPPEEAAAAEEEDEDAGELDDAEADALNAMYASSVELQPAVAVSCRFTMVDLGAGKRRLGWHDGIDARQRRVRRDDDAHAGSGRGDVLADARHVGRVRDGRVRAGRDKQPFARHAAQRAVLLILAAHLAAAQP